MNQRGLTVIGYIIKKFLRHKYLNNKLLQYVLKIVIAHKYTNKHHLQFVKNILQIIQKFNTR